MSRAVLFLLLAASVWAQSDCAIDGSVVNAETGEPIPRARVMLMTRGAQSAVSTDSAGQWAFTGVTCGQAQIILSKAGFLAGNPMDPMLMVPFRPVVLVSGSPVHGLRFPLTPQSVVTGKVVDDQGDPVMGAQVSANPFVVREGRRTFQNGSMVTTNDLGEYRLAGLPRGKYVICVHVNAVMNGLPDVAADKTTISDRCYPGPLENGATSAIPISGNDNRVDFRLERVPSVRIRGTMTGAPTGAQLSLQPAGPQGGSRNYRGVAIRPDGNFELSGVTAGSYVLSTDYREASRRLVARVPVQVGNTDIDGINVRLDSAFTLTGTVRILSAQASSRTGQDTPAPSINLLLHSSDATVGGGQLSWSKNRDSFTVTDVPPGTYRLEAPTAGPYYLKSATYLGRDIANEAIPVQGAGAIEVVFAADGGSVEGQIEDGEAKPAVASAMLLQPGRQPRTVMSGPDGHFKLSNVPPGDYMLYAWDDTQQVEYADAAWMQKNASGTSVTVEAAQTVQVKVKQQIVPPQ